MLTTIVDSRGRPPALAALALLAAACASPPPEEPPLRPVRVLTVTRSGATRERSFSGTARAPLESRLSFRVAGTIEELPVQVGARVERGQTVARLDDEDYRLAVDDAQAAQVQAQAIARNAESDLERVEGLYRNANASQNDLDAAQTSYDSARASVESAAKRLERARLQLRDTRLAAPVDGVITRVDAERNENVRAGEVVAVIASGRQLEVELGVPEVHIAQVREGASARVSFDARPGRVFRARVTEVGAAATGTATTFPVIVTLDEADSEVLPGMAAEVTLELAGDPAPRILVPAHAVGEDRQGTFVLVAEPDGEGRATVRRRPVTVRTDELIGDRLQVVSGLREGELVITAGISRIEDGQTVRLGADEGGA